MSNNSNPYDIGSEDLLSSLPERRVERVTVDAVYPKYHAVRVVPRSDNSPYVAPVLTPMQGSQTLPQVDSRAIVVYVTENTPLVVGGGYVYDKQQTPQQPPDDPAGTLTFGNGTGTTISITDDGRIDTDRAYIRAYMSGALSLSANSSFTTVPYDSVTNGTAQLFDTGSHELTAVGGESMWNVTATITFDSDPNETAVMAIYKNGTQYSIESNALGTDTNSATITDLVPLEDGDSIDIRCRLRDGSTGRTANGNESNSRLLVERRGYEV